MSPEDRFDILSIMDVQRFKGFFYGIGSVLEIFPSRPPVDFFSLFPQRADAESLSSDWNSVFGDIHSSLNKLAVESSVDGERNGIKAN